MTTNRRNRLNPVIRDPNLIFNDVEDDDRPRNNRNNQNRNNRPQFVVNVVIPNEDDNSSDEENDNEMPRLIPIPIAIPIARPTGINLINLARAQANILNEIERMRNEEFEAEFAEEFDEDRPTVNRNRLTGPELLNRFYHFHEPAILRENRINEDRYYYPFHKSAIGKRKIINILSKEVKRSWLIHARLNDPKGIHKKTDVQYINEKLDDPQWMKEFVFDIPLNNLTEISLQIRAASHNLVLKKLKDNLLDILHVVENIKDRNDEYFSHLKNIDKDKSNILLTLGLNKNILNVMNKKEISDWFANEKFISFKKIEQKFNNKYVRYTELQKKNINYKIKFFNTTSERSILYLYPEKTALEIYAELPEEEMKNKLGILDKGDINYYDYHDVANYIMMKKKSDSFYLSDKRLQNTTGVEFFANRMEYTSMIRKLSNYPSFYFPMLWKAKKAENFESGAITGEDFDDKDQVLLAYGTLDKYRLYTLSELSQTFLTNKLCFFHSENLKLTFSDEDIKNLLYITRRKQVKNDSYEAFELSVEHILETRSNIQDLLDELKNNPEEKNRAFFKKLFTFGMYCRRWKGPGHPYPLHINDTIDDDKKYEKKAEDLIDEIKSELDLTILGYLPVKQAFDGERVINYTMVENLKDLVNQLQQGSYCIRVGSKLSIVTSMFYLKDFFNEEMKDTKGNDIKFSNIAEIS